MWHAIGEGSRNCIRHTQGILSNTKSWVNLIPNVVYMSGTIENVTCLSWIPVYSEQTR
jgi:hypothetical protein